MHFKAMRLQRQQLGCDAWRGARYPSDVDIADVEVVAVHCMHAAPRASLSGLAHSACHMLTGFGDFFLNFPFLL